jgi:beta-galactosidase
MTTIQVRQLCEEGNALADRLLDEAVACLRPGGMARPRFVPELSPDTVFVPNSRQGSTMWRVAWSAPRASWYRPDFDDSGWLRSRGAFGRRGAPQLVVRRTWETPDIYLRTHFDVARIPRLLRLQLFHDRDVEIVINGRTVVRRKGYTTDYVTLDVPLDPAELLRVGTNLLAVHCRQDRRSQNLDVGLTAVY